MNESKYYQLGNDDEWRDCIVGYAEQANKCNETNTKILMNTKEELLSNIDRLHTTEMGAERIKENLKLDTNDVVDFCKKKVLDKNCAISRIGKIGIVKLIILK